MRRTLKVKVTFGVFFMTKISKQTKLEAILAYHAGFASKAKVAKYYDAIWYASRSLRYTWT